jgi:glutathione synthase/RimK-type ligase-like ATP-grasp enzyme
MMKQVACSSTIMYLLPDFEYPLEMLRAEADVVVNLIADADKGRPMLEAACTLVEQLGMPVVNPPQKILPTDRESIAQLLSGIAGCLVPVTSHFPPAMLLSGDFDLKDSPFSYPVLLRPAGTHGGEDFEKVNDKDELQAQARKHPDALHYLSNYIDYRSADGYFRKYRFMFVGGEVYPYHLAIDSKWKIHHATTDMLNQQWMQDEEAAYLEDPHAVFGEAQYRVLHAIRDAVGLDYFGIDCGLDQQGRVVVFEVNACMLVHAHNENFPYKTPAVERIKAAFYQMLKGKALPGG